MVFKSGGIVKAVQKIIAPPFCFYCRAFLVDYTALCDECDTLIKPILSIKLRVRGEIVMPVFALAAYEEPLLSLILAKGWSDYSAAKKLGTILSEKMVERLKIAAEFDYIVPIPLHFMRNAARGYNQAEIIAREVGSMSGVEVAPLLVRKKWTRVQSAFSGIGRHKNVEGAFEIDSKFFASVRGKRILLIDDVMTTGATLSQAAQLLIKAEPKSITALVACRVL